MSRYTIRIEESGRGCFRWYWTLDGPLPSIEDRRAIAFFTWTLASGFAWTRKGAEKRSHRALERARRERSAYLARTVVTFEADA